jgi:hypothetical protein
MGTRARINIFERDQVLVSIYRQSDGYPSGLGNDIFEFAKDMTIANGISGDPKGTANGMGCFAAQLIGHLKNRVGNVYIRNTRPASQGEEFSYNLHERNGKLWLDVLAGSMTAFGNPGDTEAEMKSIYSGFLKNFNPNADE